MYIELKNKEGYNEVEKFLIENDIKYFSTLDNGKLKFAILYIPKTFNNIIFFILMVTPCLLYLKI